MIPPGWIESIEPRRLLSAISPSSSVLVFNDDLTSGQPSHTDTLTITNSGSTTLAFPSSGAFTVIPDPNDATDQSADFHITNGPLPLTLAPGASDQLTLNFTASVANTIESALLQINSSDPSGPTTVQLHGLGTDGQFGYNEPSLANILTAFDIPTNIGVTDPSNSQYPETPSSASQEVPLQTMQMAGSGPVTIQMLASFNASAQPSVIFGYYTPGNPSSTTQVFTINNADDQTVNPVPQPQDSGSVDSFDPGSSPFGLYATFPGVSATDTHYSQTALNTALDPNNPQKFRFFPLENPDGSVVPNAYVVAAEDYNGTTYNSFTNFVAVIRNVEPVSTVSTTSSSFGGKSVATYTDASGHKVTLKLTGPGTGQATFDQGNPDPASITLTNTTAASTFTITVAGGTTSVGSISAGASLGRLSAAATILQGNLQIGGALGTAQLAGASGGYTLSIASGRVTSLNLGQVADLSVSSAGPIGTLQASSWTVTSGSDLITAPSMNRLAVAGSFSPSLDLTGSGTDLSIASVRGAITGGSWTVAGSAGSVSAASVASGWTGTFGALRMLNVSGDFAGDLAAGTVGTIHVAGAITGSQIRATGNISSVTASALVDSNLFAGVDPAVTTLPASASAFVADSIISSVIITGHGQPFAIQGSNVAAESLGHITFGAVDTDNDGVPFGLAAHQLGSYTRRINGKLLIWTHAMSPALLTPEGDALVNLL